MTQAIINYELLWGCKITLSIRVDGLIGAQWLTVEGKAEPVPELSQGLLHSVCVVTTMRALNVTELASAYLAVLHKLDREVGVATPMGS